MTKNKLPQPKNPQRMQTGPQELITVEIRRHRDSKGGHNHIMTGQIADKQVSVGITHSDRSKHGRNHELKVNPIGESKTAYAKKSATVADSSKYGAEVKKGKLHPDDYDFVQSVSNRAIKNRQNKKNT